jgi:hypothetical protein
VNLLTRRQRQRPTEREGHLMALEEAEVRRQADVDRLSAERNDLLAERSGIAELSAAVLMGEVSQEAMMLRRDDLESQLAGVDRTLADLNEAGFSLQRRITGARDAVLRERAEEAKRAWLLTLASRHDA